ncbi:cbb3-type cytochrome oxidase subunit 3 [Porticoccus sp. GXU_MW_L64]
MDQGTLQGIGTILAMIAFGGIVWWAFSKHKKQDFEEAAQLPFEEGELSSHQPGDKKRQDQQ